MNRYFFDLVSGSRSEYDYKGREFRTPEQARELAELIALDLEIASCDGQWAGWTVDVRNARGNREFCIPVQVMGLAA
jgi:hypothetical protein